VVGRRRVGLAASLTAIILAALAAPTPSARADDRERLILLEENDSLFFNSDKHYTQGFRLSNLGPDVAAGSFWNDPFDLVGEVPGVFAAATSERSRRYTLSLGQSVFTPKDTEIDPPDPADRPYAGWLYVGASLLQDTDRRQLEELELQLGVVGPVALGKQSQNNFHQLIGKDGARGWSEQLQNEPGIVLSYERKWRVPLIGDGAGGLDVIPAAGGSLGNIFTYGAVGGLLRIGRNLEADYGPTRIRPALSGTDYFNGDYLREGIGYYFFVGAQGRVVGRNIFLDGNSFRPSRSVDKQTLVADLQAGVSVYSGTAIRVDFSVVRRTEEFEGQHSPDVIGTASLSFSW
jgi:lipid A 3-O-deacylase